MKKLCCVLLAVAFMLCGCSLPDSSNNTFDISYKTVEKLENFKCYATYSDKTVLLEGTQAKSVYESIIKSISELKKDSVNASGDALTLTFYTGNEDSPIINDNINIHS